VQKPVAEAKLSQFTQGALWKSKKEKEKDAEERKAREEEAKAAQVLAEYVDAFDSSEGPAAGARRRGGGAFVRAGADAGGGRYNPLGGTDRSAPSSSSSRTAGMFSQAAEVRSTL
jgi:hypothetical protein